MCVLCKTGKVCEVCVEFAKAAARVVYLCLCVMFASYFDAALLLEAQESHITI
jgi:hypothetical protein